MFALLEPICPWVCETAKKSRRWSDGRFRIRRRCSGKRFTLTDELLRKKVWWIWCDDLLRERTTQPSTQTGAVNVRIYDTHVNGTFQIMQLEWRGDHVLVAFQLSTGWRLQRFSHSFGRLAQERISICLHYQTWSLAHRCIGTRWCYPEVGLSLKRAFIWSHICSHWSLPRHKLKFREGGAI